MLRFIAWVIVVCICCVGQLCWLSWERASHLGYAIIVSGIIAMAGLLATTPRDAIRLPRWLSEGLILSVTVALEFARRGDHAILRVTVALLLVVATRIGRVSPWWAALFAWFPTY